MFNSNSKIVVVGTSGSGKSTLAGKLAAHAGLKRIELDALHWEPNWVEAPREISARAFRKLSTVSWRVFKRTIRRTADASNNSRPAWSPIGKITACCA